VQNLAISTKCAASKFSFMDIEQKGWLINALNTSEPLLNFNLRKLEKFYELSIPLLQKKFEIEFRQHDVDEEDVKILHAFNKW
jgi:hypothetical protein